MIPARLFPQTAPIVEGRPRQCPQVEDLGLEKGARWWFSTAYKQTRRHKEDFTQLQALDRGNPTYCLSARNIDRDYNGAVMVMVVAAM